MNDKRHFPVEVSSFFCLKLFFPGRAAVWQHHFAAITILAVVLPPLFFFLLRPGLGKRIIIVPLLIHRIFILYVKRRNSNSITSKNPKYSRIARLCQVLYCKIHILPTGTLCKFCHSLLILSVHILLPAPDCPSAFRIFAFGLGRLMK